MVSKSHGEAFALSLVSVALIAFLASGCGSTSNNSSSSTSSSSTPTGPAFIVGTDAPVAGVVSFTVQVQSMDAIDGNGYQVPLLGGQPLRRLCAIQRTSYPGLLIKDPFSSRLVLLAQYVYDMDS